MTEPTDDVLFDRQQLGQVTLDNRLGLAPMTRTSGTKEGHATERMKKYYAKFARGGFDFLITEGTYPDTDASQGYTNQPGLATDEQAASWEPVVDAVHAEGSAIFAQLMHAGALVQGNEYVDEPVAPSAVTPKGEKLGIYGGEGEFQTPRALESGEIDDLVDEFVAAAERAVDAGFDGVEIHGANGYVLDQFLTTYTNQRDDEYGGDVANRVRLTAEVCEAVDAATPEEFVVGVRLSQTKVNDDEYGWPGGEDDAEVIFGAVSDAGVDYVHVTEADISSPAFGDGGPTLAAAAATYADVPVIANGGLEDPTAARAAIERDGASLITLGTGALANPDWPSRVANDGTLSEFDFESTLLPDATIGDAEVPADD